MKTMDFNDLKSDLLRDSQVRAAYDALEAGFAIARLESGNTLPSLRTLSRYAAAIGARVEVRLI